jgi:hypothetical protein
MSSLQMPQSNIDLPILAPPQPQQGARDGKKTIMLVMGTVMVLSMGAWISLLGWELFSLGRALVNLLPM